MSEHAVVDLARRRFTADEYQRMGKAGILGEDDRVELLDGEVVAMTPIGPVHADIVDTLTRLLVVAVGDRAVVRVQNPVRLSTLSEPEPDVAVVRAHAGGYASAHPEPDDVLLLVEVADSSLPVDHGVKIPLYAAAGIVEVWLVDATSRQVTVHRQPEAGGYQQVHTAGSDDTLIATGLDDLSVAVADLLGEQGG